MPYWSCGFVGWLVGCGWLVVWLLPGKKLLGALFCACGGVGRTNQEKQQLKPFGEHFGTTFGPCWHHFGPILGQVGTLWGPFWGLGAILGPSWAPLGTRWAPLGAQMPKTSKNVTWWTPPQGVPKEGIFEHFSILFRVLFLAQVFVQLFDTLWSPWDLKK